MIYDFLLLLGGLGYASLLVLGSLGARGHHSQSPGQMNAGHGHGALGHGHGSGSHSHGAANAGHRGGVTGAKGGQQGPNAAQGIGQSTLLLVKSVFSISPLNIFSLCLGAGLAGRAASQFFSSSLIVALIAVAGALFASLAILQPLTRLILGFASRPSLGLEGTIDQLATAETAFDQNGKGVVTIMVDDQISRMLAKLRDADRDVRVRKGDKLIILEVDPKKGSCIVSAEMIEEQRLAGITKHE